MTQNGHSAGDDDVVIVAAHRTPIGSLNGNLAGLKADDLGTVVLRHILKATNNVQPDEVIIGQALTAAQGQNPARQTSINAGLPNTVPATTINMLCGSGLKAVALGYQAIKAGDAKLIIAGGQESMSQAPHAINLRKETKMGDGKLADTMLLDGLTDAFHDIHMGVTAENVAKKYNISREEQDDFSLESQQKFKAAFESNSFQAELVTISMKTKQNGTIQSQVVNRDEHPRPLTTIEKLSALHPVFKPSKEGATVTAGNSSGINDGAALLLLASAEEAKNKNLTPLVKIKSWAQSGNDPQLMGVSPIDSIQAALKKANWSKDEVDLFEINEAFASQSIAIIRELGLDKAKVNVNGGSIALGHPIGCSGARILVTLIHALVKRELKRGVAALCIGGGMSIAICVERV